MPAAAYSGSAWRKVRDYVLWRDGYRCRLRLDCCAGTATEVDHVDEVWSHGACFDAARLRASCGPCNRKRGGQAAQRKSRIARATATVGPSRRW